MHHAVTNARFLQFTVAFGASHNLLYGGCGAFASFCMQQMDSATSVQRDYAHHQTAASANDRGLAVTTNIRTSISTTFRLSLAELSGTQQTRCSSTFR